jgi:hypothetical protein
MIHHRHNIIIYLYTNNINYHNDELSFLIFKYVFEINGNQKN